MRITSASVAVPGGGRTMIRFGGMSPRSASRSAKVRTCVGIGGGSAIDIPPPDGLLPRAHLTPAPGLLRHRQGHLLRLVRELAHVLRDPHRAELRPAHGTELGALEPLRRQRL